MRGSQTTYSAVLGVVLTNARKQQGLEQAEMASRMGLSQASYSRLEGGKSAFSLDQLYMAAEALGLNPEVITSRLNNTVTELRASGVDVLPLIRGNAIGAKKAASVNTATGAKKGNEVGALVAGAALGALVFSIFSNK